MNVNVEIQYATDRQGGKSDPLSFSQIETIRKDVNAPVWATISLEEESYGCNVHVHWNTDVRQR